MREPRDTVCGRRGEWVELGGWLSPSFSPTSPLSPPSPPPAPIHADPSDWAPHYPFSPTACQGHSLCQRDTREGSSWNGDTCETSAKNSFIYPDRSSLRYNVPLIVCKTFVLTFLLPIFKSRSLPFKNADNFWAIPAIATMHPMGTQKTIITCRNKIKLISLLVYIFLIAQMMIECTSVPGSASSWFPFAVALGSLAV